MSVSVPRDKCVACLNRQTQECDRQADRWTVEKLWSHTAYACDTEVQNQTGHFLQLLFFFPNTTTTQIKHYTNASYVCMRQSNINILNLMFQW